GALSAAAEPTTRAVPARDRPPPAAGMANERRRQTGGRLVRRQRAPGPTPRRVLPSPVSASPSGGDDRPHARPLVEACGLPAAHAPRDLRDSAIALRRAAPAAAAAPRE